MIQRFHFVRPLLLVMFALVTGYAVMKWGASGRFHNWMEKRLGTHRIPPDVTLSVYPDQKPSPYGKNVDVPTLYCYFAPEEIANGSGLLVCVGGAYKGLSMSSEGQSCVKWLRPLGMHIFLLQYSIWPQHQYPDSVNEVIRSIRFLRANAAKFGLDENKIGVAGFSAGGHLASTLGTHYDAGNPYAFDPVDRVSSRPDFMLLAYPVITFKLQTSGNSRENLLGKNPPEYLINFLSNDQHVTPDTPPAFIIHADDDSMVSSEHSLRFHRALQKNNVPHQLLMLERGDHGVSMRFWLAEVTDWLREKELIRPALTKK